MDDAEAQQLTEQITRKHAPPSLEAALRRMSPVALDWRETAEEFPPVCWQDPTAELPPREEEASRSLAHDSEGTHVRGMQRRIAETDDEGDQEVAVAY